MWYMWSRGSLCAPVYGGKALRWQARSPCCSMCVPACDGYALWRQAGSQGRVVLYGVVSPLNCVSCSLLYRCMASHWLCVHVDLLSTPETREREGEFPCTSHWPAPVTMVTEPHTLTGSQTAKVHIKFFCRIWQLGIADGIEQLKSLGV